MELSDVPVGSTVIVRGVDAGTANQGRRLEDLGMLAGTRVRVERRAPFGDPTIYEFRGARMAVRRVDAALVEVDSVRDGAD